MLVGRSLLVTASRCPIEQASRLLYAARLSCVLVGRSLLVTASRCPIEQAGRLLYAARLSPMLVGRSLLVTASRCPIEQASRLLYAARTGADVATSWQTKVAEKVGGWPLRCAGEDGPISPPRPPTPHGHGEESVPQAVEC
jgi:hypothetical protein